AERVQFPGRVLDFSRKEPSPACRIEPKSCREKNIKIALFHDSLFLRDSDPCLRPSTTVAEIEILFLANLHVHIGPEIRKAESYPRSRDCQELRGVERKEPDSGTSGTVDIRAEVHFRKLHAQGAWDKRRPKAAK